MSRIIIAECKQEVSSFNPVPSGYDDFLVAHDKSLFEYHRMARDEVGGALAILDEIPGLRLVPAFGARAISSGGTLMAEAWKRLSEEFLDAVADSAPADGAYFALHGAMAAENELDPEGFLLTESRRLLGDGVPIVVSLDLHGILTDRMLGACDAVVVYHTYPHVDFFETGLRAARLLVRLLRGEAKPVTARVKIPALVRGDELITMTGAFGKCIRMAQHFEAGPRGLSAGMLIGNPFTDVPELGSCSVVVMDDDHNAAEQAAIDLADFTPPRPRRAQREREP